MVKLLVPLRRLRSAKSLKLQPIAKMLRHLAQKVHFPTSSEVREVIYSARKTNTVSLPRFIVVRRGFVHAAALLPPLQEGGMGEYVLDRVVTSCSGNMTRLILQLMLVHPAPTPNLPMQLLPSFYYSFDQSIIHILLHSFIQSLFVTFPFVLSFLFFCFSFSFVSGFASSDHKVGNNLK